MKKSDKSIILVAIGLLLGVASFFVHKNLTADTEVMQKANAELRQEVQRLQELADNKQKYIDDTAAMSEKIEEIKAQFPAQYLPEDEILYTIGAEESFDMVAQNINMNPTTIVEVAAPVSEEAPAQTTEGGEASDQTTEDVEAQQVSTEQTAAPEIALYRTPVSVAVLSTYISIKDFIKMVNEDADRKSIDTISVAFDATTGELLSNIDISMYSLTGTEAEYTSPKVDGVVYGTNDIFNSVQKKAAVEANKASGAQATAQ